jgi:PAS domain S-box-containing protein
MKLLKPLIKNNKLSSILIENSPDMMILLDEQGKIIDCNEYLEKNTKYKKSELIEFAEPINLIVDEDRTIIQSSFKELKITNIIQNVPVRVKRKEGDSFSSIWSGITLRDNNNHARGYLITGKDISNISNLDQKLILTKKRNRQEKLALLGEFSARIAHDIRNPLSIVLISLENLKTLYGADETKQKQLDRAERSIDRITHQIEDVLNFVKEKPLNLENVLLSELLSESLDSIKIPDKVKIKIPKNDILLFCDKKQFLIVMNNLILNGIQAMGNVGTIELFFTENNDEIILQIIDSGPGIPNNVLNEIFEPLFTTKQSGTGLGLVSVKSIVEAHGGTISVTTNPTTFTIKFLKIK